MRHPLRLLAFLGVAAVVVLAAAAIRGSFAPRGPSAGAPRAKAVAPASEPSGDVVARAIEIAKGDSAHKEAWVDEIPDLELASLPAAARATFLKIANGRRCDCGCGYTLAACRRFDSTCDVSGPRAAALFDSVRTGRITRADGFAEPPAVR